MAQKSVPTFNAASIDQALEAAHRHAQERMPKAKATHSSALYEGTLKISAQCISITIENGQACIELPFGIGKKCLPVPSWVPNGTVGQACLNICTTLGIPCGVEVSVSVAGVQVVSEHFGCSC